MKKRSRFGVGFLIDWLSCLRWDLWWPPVWGGSYWTASLQYRALRGGARLGHTLGRQNNVEEYEAHASMILDYMQVSCEYGGSYLVPETNTKISILQTFWNEKEGFMSETTVTDVKKGRSGYGPAPLTVSVYNLDPSLGCDDATVQPCSPRALSSLKR